MRVLFNVGRLLTLDVIANLQEWARSMGADPFQVDTENLCPHLRERINIKRVGSDAFEIIEKQFSDPKPPQNPISPLKPLPNHIKAAEKPVSLPQIPKEFRFDA
jgi:hypothetical protein